MFQILVVLGILLAITLTIMICIMYTGVRYEQHRDGLTYYIKFNHLLPRITPWHEFAVTIGDTIYVTGNMAWPELHAHEYAHILQWNRYGFLKMAFFYVRGLISSGYGLNHWAENEAKKYADIYKDKFPMIQV